VKYAIIIGDGMADNPVGELGGMTPLEKASIPFIDQLCRRGKSGSVLTVPRGIAPGSDTAILSIMGYDPVKYYSGRAPLEAAGCGVSLAAGDVAYRCNMVSLAGVGDLEDKIIVSHSGGSIDGESSMELIKYLAGNVRFKELMDRYAVSISPAPSFRHIAVQKDADIKGISLIPPHDHLSERAGEHLPSGCQNAEHLKSMMRLANELLEKHPINAERVKNGKLPANGVWFWAEGTVTELPDFKAKHGKTGFIVSAVPLVRGIGALCGLDYIEIDGATGELDTNLEGKADAAANGLARGYDFTVIHVEAPDECTHNGDTAGKLQAIEWLDSRCVKRFAQTLDAAGEEYRLLILSDHKTLTSTRGHDGDPVPFILYDSRRDMGGGLGYTERNADNGVYVGEGHTLIDMLFGDDI
jgi:2,3-bisphosphoglycerate-independent phosphoglycerate mutase